jgi:hypothetical protein
MENYCLNESDQASSDWGHINISVSDVSRDPSERSHNVNPLWMGFYKNFKHILSASKSS